jgi:hypothetical protein
LALAVEGELSRSPIDIVESQCRHLAATKPESSEQKQDREVTQTHVSTSVATLQKQPKLSKRNELGYTCLSPTRNGRYSTHQITLKVAAKVQEAKERAHCGYHKLRGAYARRFRFVQNEVCDVVSTETFELNTLRVEVMGQKLLSVAAILEHRRGLETTFLDEKTPVLFP